MAVDMKDRVVQLRSRVLIGIGAQLLVTYSVHRLGDHVEMHPLGRLRLEIHEIAQRLCRRIGQPFVDADAVARGFGDFLPVFVKKQLVAEVFGLLAAQYLADAVVDRGVPSRVPCHTSRNPRQERPSAPRNQASTAI